MIKRRYYLGIDPGVVTGLALYDRLEKRFVFVRSSGIGEAQMWVEKYEHKDQLFVKLEDARQRIWFGKSGREVLQGAGSIKRDCQVWEEWLEILGIPCEMVPPKKNKTKLDSVRFNKYTGWKGKTNEHARDAGMLVYGA